MSGGQCCLVRLCQKLVHVSAQVPPGVRRGIKRSTASKHSQKNHLICSSDLLQTTLNTLYTLYTHINIHARINSTKNQRYTGCNRRNGPDFGRVFLRSYYTDITQNTYIQSSMVTEILAIGQRSLKLCQLLLTY